jgi:hypothetical protein
METPLAFRVMDARVHEEATLTRWLAASGNRPVVPYLIPSQRGTQKDRRSHAHRTLDDPFRDFDRFIIVATATP